MLAIDKSFLEEVLSSSFLRSTVSTGSLLTSLLVRVKLCNLGGFNSREKKGKEKRFFFCLFLKYFYHRA